MVTEPGSITVRNVHCVFAKVFFNYTPYLKNH